MNYYLLSLNRTDRGAVEMSIIFRVTPHNSVPTPIMTSKKNDLRIMRTTFLRTGIRFITAPSVLCEFGYFLNSLYGRIYLTRLFDRLRNMRINRPRGDLLNDPYGDQFTRYRESYHKFSNFLLMPCFNNKQNDTNDNRTPSYSRNRRKEGALVKYTKEKGIKTI